MVNVQHRCLAALHEDVLTSRKSLVEFQLSINNHGSQTVAVAQEVLHDLLWVNCLAVVHLHQHLVLDVQRRLNLLAQDGLIEDVLHADANTGDLVRVSRTDAAARGANGALAQETLLHAVQSLVVRRHKMSVRGDTQARGIRTACLKAVDLIKEGLEIDNHAIAQHRNCVLRENAGGKKLELILLAANYNSMASVVAAIRLDYVVNLATEDIGGLTFTFVAPLSANDDDCCHVWVSLPND